MNLQVHRIEYASLGIFFVFLESGTASELLWSQWGCQSTLAQQVQ